MAIAVYFNPAESSPVDTAKYQQVNDRLDAAGQGSPAGRIHHSAFGPPNAIMVYEIWESPEQFEAFGATLMPILGELGIDVGEPMVMPLQNVVQ